MTTLWHIFEFAVAAAVIWGVLALIPAPRCKECGETKRRGPDSCKTCTSDRDVHPIGDW